MEELRARKRSIRTMEVDPGAGVFVGRLSTNLSTGGTSGQRVDLGRAICTLWLPIGLLDRLILLTELSYGDEVDAGSPGECCS